VQVSSSTDTTSWTTHHALVDVLLVVSDLDELDALGALLALHAEIVAVPTIDHALKLLGTVTFDAVVSDNNLKEQRSGAWLSKEVGRRWPGTRRILLADSRRSEADGLDLYGVENLLFKPVGGADILLALGVDDDASR
jgi:response regulator RpfG family c-di-GMP phosphodiesterase